MKIVKGKIKLNLRSEKSERIPIRYIIKEDAGKVIAIAKLNSSLFSNIVESKYDILCPWAAPKRISNRFDMNETYRAVATLDPEDTWNERIGMRVAGKKLKDKLNAALDRRAIFLSNYLRKIADEL